MSGLHRCGKSCRLRWINYLKPDIKRGNFAQDEEDLIIKLHALLGNRYTNTHTVYNVIINKNLERKSSFNLASYYIYLVYPQE